ncbi:2Fe-2S iron-sulfur cluster-binding protein [Prosthecomicrobium sp. N25]|uniref:2Fe-2S iron-sulfur cluster-binding protein n=1 Tax=Prosthecomicrobium sp. N25 TaxID=3129254 RepID=UPI0030779347
MTVPTSPARPLWDPETDDRLVCRAVLEETAEVKTFVFAAPEGRLFAYEPGQFMNLEVEVAGGVETRSYTLSSSPARPHTVSISVKRIPGGLVSNHLHDTLMPGTSVKAQLPLGDFTTARHRSPKYLFLAAGVGATPLMSMLRAEDDLATGADVVFLNAARRPEDLVFRRELETIAARNRSVRLAHVVTGQGREPWAGFHGRIDRALLAAVAPDLLEREVFVCGPAGFMARVRDILGEAGFDMGRHHEESFAFGAGGPEPEVPADPAAREYRITFARSGRTIACDGSTTILAAARKAGIALPSACTKGLCGTCKSKKASGEVEMKHQGGIRPREIEAGMILLCCSKPQSEVVVER